MCGIIGKFCVTQSASPMDLSSIAHRGPDASGEWSSPCGRCWLGHTRLAIVDLTDAGRQPMSCACGRYTIVFNGEIYNHAQLRADLRDVPWRGNSDTETLVELWCRHGESSLNRLRGMFAFAVFDSEEQSLTLVRDRMGIKPVYFKKDQDGVMFASEVRSLVSEDDTEAKYDGAALATYLATGHFPASGEILNGIEVLPPGNSWRQDSTGEVKWTHWWPGTISHASASRTGPDSIHSARRLIRKSVEDAVEEHLMADVPIACFLSGGIDSSIITMVASKFHSGPLQTVSVVFPQIQFDERDIARVVSAKAGTDHLEIEVSTDDCLEWVTNGVRLMDLPSPDAINTFIVSTAVRRLGIKVALSGLGGDELFGGYPSFASVPRLSYLKWLPSTLRDLAIAACPTQIQQKLVDLKQWRPYHLALARRRWRSDQEIARAGIDGKPSWPPFRPQRDAFSEISWAEIVGYMEPMLLRDSDQMSMANSLELRVPFLDHRLVELAMSIPSRWKSAGRRSKSLLVDSFIEVLPQEVWNKPKMGFGLPMDEWMRGPLQGFCEEGLSYVYPIFESTFVDAEKERFKSRKSHWTRLWQLVVLGHQAGRSVATVN